MAYRTDAFESTLSTSNATLSFPMRPVYTEEMQKLIRKMIVRDPRKRPDIFDILEHVSALTGLAMVAQRGQQATVSNPLRKRMSLRVASVSGGGPPSPSPKGSLEFNRSQVAELLAGGSSGADSPRVTSSSVAAYGAAGERRSPAPTTPTTGGRGGARASPAAAAATTGATFDPFAGTSHADDDHDGAFLQQHRATAKAPLGGGRHAGASDSDSDPEGGDLRAYDGAAASPDGIGGKAKKVAEAVIHKLSDALHDLTGAPVDKWIRKATSEEPLPPKWKYLRYLIVYSWDVAYTRSSDTALSPRPAAGTPVIRQSICFLFIFDRTPDRLCLCGQASSR